jgi:hypothetical protein
MATDRAPEIYKLPQQIVEPLLGDMKESKGMKGFLTRGIKTVKGEFNLICAAVNMKRIWARVEDKNGHPYGLVPLMLQIPACSSYQQRPGCCDSGTATYRAE